MKVLLKKKASSLKLYGTLLAANGGAAALMTMVADGPFNSISTDHLVKSPLKTYLDRIISRIPIKIHGRRNIVGTWGYTGQGNKRFKTVVADDKILIINTKSYKPIYTVDVFNTDNTITQRSRVIKLRNAEILMWRSKGTLISPDGDDHTTATVLVGERMTVLTQTEVIVMDLGNTKDALLVKYDIFSIKELMEYMGSEYNQETGSEVAEMFTEMLLAGVLHMFSNGRDLIRDPGPVFT